MKRRPYKSAVDERTFWRIWNICGEETAMLLIYKAG